MQRLVAEGFGSLLVFLVESRAMGSAEEYATAISSEEHVAVISLVEENGEHPNAMPSFHSNRTLAHATHAHNLLYNYNINVKSETPLCTKLYQEKLNR